MPGIVDHILLWVAVLSSVAVVTVCIYSKQFTRYSFLNYYLLVGALFTLGTRYMVGTYGLRSKEYFYYYYLGDAVGNILGYLVIASFFDRLLRGSAFHAYLRPTLRIFFTLVVGISIVFVSGNADHLYSRLVVEFEQNMFFVGVLLTFLLSISLAYLGSPSRRLVLLVSGLGVYFALHAASYALRNLFASTEVLRAVVPPLAYNLLAWTWLYTFLRVPESETVPLSVKRAAPRLAPVTPEGHTEVS